MLIARENKDGAVDMTQAAEAVARFDTLNAK